jgi:peptidyl-prolyl cis-trans isomerase B (cyclophilin B)
VIRTRPLPLVHLVLLAMLVVLAGCGSGGDTGGDPQAGTCSYHKDGSTPARKVHLPPADPPADNPTSLTISTSAGDIPITLEAAQAPCAVNSLVSLADQGYFDGTSCHRLTTQGYFVLQCGDPTGTGRGGPGYTFSDELVPDDPRLQPCGNVGGTAYCTYNAGLVAMANAGPDTNGSQFFLVYGNSKFPPSYTVVGNMGAAGLKVVKQIAAQGIAAQGLGPGDGTPKEPVKITSLK